MTVYISGDSNSVKRDGWTKVLREHPSMHHDVQNISIGGAPSHMSLFRAMQGLELKQGDVFVWAYGINDILYISRANYTVDEMIWVVKQIIKICSDAGAVFAPLIFQPRHHSQRKHITEYREKLHTLFDLNSIDFFDDDLTYLSENPTQKLLPISYYSDYLHYAQDAVVTDAIVNGTLDLIARANTASISGGSLTPIKLLDTFSGGEKGLFENSAVGKLKTWKPGPDGLKIMIPSSGRVVGLFLTTTRQGGVFDITFAGQTYTISAAFADRQFNRTMLKFISLAAVTGAAFDCESPQEMVIAWNDCPVDVLADHWFLKDLEPLNISGQQSCMVSVLIEDLSGPSPDNSPGALNATASKYRNFGRWLKTTSRRPFLAAVRG